MSTGMVCVVFWQLVAVQKYLFADGMDILKVYLTLLTVHRKPRGEPLLEITEHFIRNRIGIT